MIALAAAVIEWSTCVPIGISVMALVVSGLSYGTVLHRGRKRVQIRTSVVAKKFNPYVFYYRCQVTNVGYIGVQIHAVSLVPPKGSRGVAIRLKLPKSEQPRKLDQGESQEWEMLLEELQEMLQNGESLKVIALAEDTTGTEYEQKPEDSVPIHPAGFTSD